MIGTTGQSRAMAHPVIGLSPRNARTTNHNAITKVPIGVEKVTSSLTDTGSPTFPPRAKNAIVLNVSKNGHKHINKMPSMVRSHVAVAFRPSFCSFNSQWLHELIIKRCKTKRACLSFGIGGACMTMGVLRCEASAASRRQACWSVVGVGGTAWVLRRQTRGRRCGALRVTVLYARTVRLTVLLCVALRLTSGSPARKRPGCKRRRFARVRAAARIALG